MDRFFQDLGKCNRIEKVSTGWKNDLTEVLQKLGPTLKNNNITHWTVEGCYLGVPEANYLFNTFREMKGLEELYICGGIEEAGHDHDLNDNAVAGCIPSLAACTGMQKLILNGLSISTHSCAALSDVFPRMAALRRLNLYRNSIGDDCVEVLVRGLAGCKPLRSLRLDSNMISDNGFDTLIQGLPDSVRILNISYNQITLVQQLSLLRFKKLYLTGNSLSPDGPKVIAMSLSDPGCRLEILHLCSTGIKVNGAAILAPSLRMNCRLKKMDLGGCKIKRKGWDAFSAILCNTASINATHGSNHTLQDLGPGCDFGLIWDHNSLLPQDIKILLELNCDRDKSRVAAKKILQTHRHLDMKPLMDRELDLLPHVVAWLERYAETRLELKLSSIFEFVRAMPQEVVDMVAGKKKGKKRSRNRL